MHLVPPDVHTGLRRRLIGLISQCPHVDLGASTFAGTDLDQLFICIYAYEK